MIEYIVIGILLVIVAGLGWLLNRSVTKVLVYENIINETYTITQVMHERLKRVDSTGHFQADDEVGFVFSDIKHIVEILSSVFVMEPTMKNDGGSDGKKTEE